MIEVKDYLRTLGYKDGAIIIDQLNKSVWNMYKRTNTPSKLCLTNDKEPQVSIYYHHHLGNSIDIASYEVEICQENDLGWVHMKYYGLNEEDLMNKINDIEDSLIRSWDISWCNDSKDGGLE